MIRSKIVKNNKGIILLTVIMLTIILSIIAIGIMSVNISQVKTSQTIIDSIKAEQLAIGLFYRCHQGRSQGAANCPVVGSDSENLDEKIFTPTITITNPGGTPNGTEQVVVTIDYPST